MRRNKYSFPNGFTSDCLLCPYYSKNVPGIKHYCIYITFGKIHDPEGHELIPKCDEVLQHMEQNPETKIHFK